MIVRPKLFLDTNICINVASGQIPAEDWRRARKHIGAKFRYQISFITIKELFGRLARCADEYFEQNKEPLRVLYGPGKRYFLPYPSVFSLRTVLGLHSVARKSDTHNLPEEKWAESIVKAVLDAPSKVQLKAGIPIRNRIKPLMQYFDLDHFDRHENAPQNEHADILQGIREGRNDMPEPMTWAEWIPRYHGIESTEDECLKLVRALDAAYRFSCTLSRMSKDKGYDFHAHATDWGDATQLFYLCDPLMHFVTTDENCQNYTVGSSQSRRILLWREFVGSIP
jgi:hypothetical protein